MWGLATIAIALGVACGLDAGSIIGVNGAGDDGSVLGDGGPDDSATGDESNSSFDAGTLTDGALSHRIFANTSTAIYDFDVDTHVLTRRLGFAFCGLDGGYDTFDLAVASTRQVFVLPWKASGQFWLYAINADGGCVDVHGGPGANPGAPDMWAGFQNTGGTDTLFALVQGQNTLYAYNAAGGYIGQDTNTLRGTTAKGDIACSSALCYTVVPHDKCDDDPGPGNDCIWSFENDGGSGTQVGNIGTDKVVGLAYYAGNLYGFCNDGSIYEASTTAPSAGAKLTDVSLMDAGPTALSWIGAGSLPN